MCSRYILANTLPQIETLFGLPSQDIELSPNYNISPGQYAPVITNESPYQLQLFKFGLTPFWAKSAMNLFNARAEGDSNPSDDPKIHGAMGIIQKKAFRKPIRSQRCLVIATAFIAGPKDVGLSKPYLIYLQKHKNPFAFAGIWDTWINPATLQKEYTFAIITTTANTLLQKIGQHRMPVILSDGQAKRWINSNTDLSRITAMLKKYDSDQMNAYPITPRIKDPTQNDKALIQPIGEKLIIEETYTRTAYPYTSGYHQAKKANKANDQTYTLGDKIKPPNS
jgi:putative SOS response-associated peptidase YedK